MKTTINVATSVLGNSVAKVKKLEAEVLSIGSKVKLVVELPANIPLSKEIKRGNALLGIMPKTPAITPAQQMPVVLQKITVKDKNETLVLEHSEIEYWEAARSYHTIHTVARKKYVRSKNLNKIEPVMPAGIYFRTAN